MTDRFQRKLKTCKLDYAKQYPDRMLRSDRVLKGWRSDYIEFCRIESLREAGQERLVRQWRRMLRRCQTQRVFDNLQMTARKANEARKKLKVELSEKKAVARKSVQIRKEEEHARSENVLQNLANMELNRRRKEARKIKSNFCEKWEKNYGFLFRKSQKARKKLNRIKREAMAKLRRDPKSWRIKRKIRNSPCSCYWCGEFLPNGGEVDHVVPLAKGGDDGFGNLVPACQHCNRVKHDGMPNGSGLKVSPQMEMALTGGDLKNL